MDVAARSYLSSNISTQEVSTAGQRNQWVGGTQILKRRLIFCSRTKQGNDCLTKKASLFTSYHSLHRTMDYFTPKCLKKEKTPHASTIPEERTESANLWPFGDSH